VRDSGRALSHTRFWGGSVKTFVVRLPNNDRDCWTGNAESPEEAVAYAIAKGNISIVSMYSVWDQDLNHFWVSPQRKLEG
jgi:hypothetical protein